MIMSWIYLGLMTAAAICAMITGQGSALSAATIQGAQEGVTLAIGLAGSICLWSGVGKLMEAAGITDKLASVIRPLLSSLFPGTKNDPALRRDLSANICANFLGLGNAATPMGIRAVQRMANRDKPGIATDEMCRLVVLNTASIQLIPSNVAAVRSSLGCLSPFDILPAVWLTSLCSAGAGILAAYLLGKLWRHG